MSILERIRKRSGLTIGLIGLALLLFVITDALDSRYGIFGAGQNTNDVGEIDGEKIGIKLFEAKVNEAVVAYKLNTKQENIDQNTMDMLREQAWNQLVQEATMGKEYDELGIKVTNDELFELIQGDDPHPQIKSAPIFQNQQTGQYDKTYVIRFLKNITESTDETAKAQWQQFEDGLYKETLSKKYMALLKKGVYATSIETKRKHNDRSRSVDLDLIALTYSSIADSTIKVEEGDLKSYFNKNADKYKEKETSRKLEYVLFDVTPSAEDTASIQKWVSDQLTQFAAAKNDTLYVDLNSDTKFDTMAKRLNMFPENVQQQLFSQPVGSIVGPVYENGKFSIYKIAGIKEDSLWQMRASHILFKTDGPTKQDTLNTMKKANEVMAEIRKGTKTFADAAQQYGTDGTASRGGDLGWFVEGQMVKEFNDAVKAGKKGDMRIVKTQFGIHILKITEDKSRKLVCAGVLERKIEPGEKTTNLAFNMASQFAASSQSEEDFDKNITEKAYTKQTADVVREADKQISGMQEAREVVRWAFNAKKGEVSDVFAIGDKYMVAKLAAIREKDKADFDASKLKAEIEYRKEKKAEQLIEKANTAMTGASDMQTISNKLQVPVTSTIGLTFENANIAYVGADNTFTGTLFGATVNGKISGPVKGDQAVYLFKLNKFNDAPAIADFSAFKIELLGNLSQRMEYGAMEVLKEINNVKDNRAKFY